MKAVLLMSLICSFSLITFAQDGTGEGLTLLAKPPKKATSFENANKEKKKVKQNKSKKFPAPEVEQKK